MPTARRYARLGVVRFAELPARLAAGGAARFKLAGIVVARKERNSARGSRFAFVQMSDASGVFEVTLFSEVLAQSRELLDGGQPLLVTADVRAEEETLRLTAQHFEPLDRVVAQAAAGLKVLLGEAAALSPLKQLIAAAKRRPRPRHPGRAGRRRRARSRSRSPAASRSAPPCARRCSAVPGVLDVQEV